MSTLNNTDLAPITRGVPIDRNDESVPSQPSKSTLWRHARGRPTRRDKADSQQYLTPREEKALLEYVLRMDQRGYPLPVKFLGSIAHVIKRQRSSAFQVPAANDGIRPPGKNWPQGFYKRYPELKARKVRPLDWARHDIYDKVVEWFTVIGKELSNPAIVLENVYNMDETGVLLSVLGSLKVLVSRQSLRNYRGTGVKRTLVTAIECISADGRCLDPLIIWPAATHRSTWTTHPTPGWHFACSKKGYTDTDISLYWIKHVFDPLTRARANHKPRILISDGFGTHESPELLKFAFENNIILCRLGSHTSHKTQPCDVGPFGPLKTTYREQAERLFRGGANMIGKQHFTLLYDRARTVAFTPRNIKSGWFNSGLVPLNAARVLNDLPKPQVEEIMQHTTNMPIDLPSDVLRTPVTWESLTCLRTKIEQGSALDSPTRHYFQKLANATEKAFADRSILLDENRLLFEQNNEKTTRQSVKSTMPGNARIMTYDAIVEAEQKRAAKVGATSAKRGGQRPQSSKPGKGERSRADEVEFGNREIKALGLEEYCSVLQF
jgi:DDE superfamily endonuclease